MINSVYQKYTSPAHEVKCMSSSPQMESHGRRRTSHVIPRHTSKKPCIISDMPPIDRTEKMTLRLTPDEVLLRDALAKRLGINPSGVLRMALLRLAEAEKITLETQKERPLPKE